LYAKAEKCKFHSDSMEYLGYVLSPSGLIMSDVKVKTIQEWPEPKKVKDIQSFLGFANFYRRFIFNYSDIVIPLTCLTRKNTPWNFDDDCRMAFNTLKQAFISAPILMHWVPDVQLVMETDASDYALAAILSIMTKDNEIHPVAFHSQTFFALELNYNIHNKELLAIFEAFKIWQHYLERSTSPIDIVMVSQLCHGPVVTYCMVYHYTKRAMLARLLANESLAIYVVHLNRYFVIPP